MEQISPGSQTLSFDQIQGRSPARQPGRTAGRVPAGPSRDRGAGKPARLSAKRQNVMFRAAASLLVYLSSRDLAAIPSSVGCPPGTHQPARVTSCGSGGRTSSGKI